jgi:hypothetical protein
MDRPHANGLRVMLGVNMDEVVANSDVESMAGVNL